MTLRSGTARPSGSRFKFLGDTVSELKKVVWLTRREATYLTGLVLIVAITAGILLGLLDFGFTRLIDELFLGG